MKISIIHATRRPSQAFEAMCQWLSNASMKTPVEYILSVDTTDPKDYDFSKTLEYAELKTIRNNNRSAIDAFNQGAKAATGDIFVCISDDFECQNNWDVSLLQALAGKEDFIVKTRDGLQKTLITLPIMDRKYYDRFGYIYHPDFLHLHCDEEMTIVGHMLGRVITLDLLFPHNHHTTGKFKKDAISVKNDNTWTQGQATLERHAKNNFGIENPLIQRKDIIWR